MLKKQRVFERWGARTPAPVNASNYKAKVLDGGLLITDRPADHIAPEMEKN